MIITSFNNEYQNRLNIWSDIQDHMPVLYDTVCQYEHTIVLELGIRFGNSTSAFLAGAEKVDGMVHSVDINEPNVPAWWKTSNLWNYYVADDMEISLAFLPEQVDVLFIDTSHDYEHTLNELRKFSPLVGKGGTILMHDTLLEVMPGLKKQDPFPVSRAIIQFCQETNRRWRNLDGEYGLGIIDV